MHCIQMFYNITQLAKYIYLPQRVIGLHTALNFRRYVDCAISLTEHIS